MTLKVRELKIEVFKLKTSIQAIYEIDGLTWQVFKMLKTFEKEDWQSLKIEVSRWSSIELEVLSLTIIGYDNPKGECIEHNFVYYLFTIANNGISREILEWNDEKKPFYDDKFLTLELLNQMREKLEILSQRQFIEKTVFDTWIKRIQHKIFEKNR